MHTCLRPTIRTSNHTQRWHGGNDGKGNQAHTFQSGKESEDLPIQDVTAADLLHGANNESFYADEEYGDNDARSMLDTTNRWVVTGSEQDNDHPARLIRQVKRQQVELGALWLY